MKSYTCPVCDSISNISFSVREMMFGLREKFNYSQCSDCHTIFITEIPENISKYYSSSYYSLQELNTSKGFKAILKRARGKYLFQNSKYLPGKFITNIFGVPDYAYYIKKFDIKFQNTILDVGCGSGQLLYELNVSGFKYLTGIDPFIEKESISIENVHIHKCSLENQTGSFDAIMLNHVFEHLQNPALILNLLHERLHKSGKLMIRIPIVSAAWEKYKTNWVQLDAPRHYCLFTQQSFEYLADKAGFRINEVLYDSSSFQFWGSEQYSQDIPLMSEKSYIKGLKHSIFTKNQINAFEKEAVALNTQSRGDQACFYLSKK
jgi:SAM-dependent methyltransferase